VATTWQLHQAKNRLSEVIDRAREEGPQIVTRRGREVAVVVSREQYERLAQPRQSILEFFADSPLVGIDLEVSRDGGGFRDVEL